MGGLSSLFCVPDDTLFFFFSFSFLSSKFPTLTIKVRFHHHLKCGEKVHSICSSHDQVYQSSKNSYKRLGPSPTPKASTLVPLDTITSPSPPRTAPLTPQTRTLKLHLPLIHIGKLFPRLPQLIRHLVVTADHGPQTRVYRVVALDFVAV